MPKKGGNISLSSYDDIFQTDQSREEAQQERVQEIPLSELHPFKGHPFKVLDDEAMQKTVESIAQFGVMTPAIARPRPEGGYEIIAGHRRHHASELAGKDTMPVIVRDMDDDAATILMVDSNLQRETLLPSERAFAFKIYDMTDTSYNRELWLLEDMSFALVHNVSMVIKSGDFYYATEYRSIVKLLKERDDLFFTPESLTEELEEMCIPQWENEATIYEL